MDHDEGAKIVNIGSLAAPHVAMNDCKGHELPLARTLNVRHKRGQMLGARTRS